jgi:DNA-binding NtrC family response regulator
MAATRDGALNRDEAPATPRKILVVDDEADVLTTTVDLLQAMGSEVLGASTAQEALQTLAKEPDIEVMLADVLMPGMNGVELAREARRLLPDLDVILLSGFPSAAMDASAGEPGEFKFLMKPFTLSEIALLLGGR